ncbi:Sugar phosphate permease [Modestobacter sp. DSM 44400]|uniref:MFS transporter n=1 Tax=Modestobacter sp. DSM 44400 TaxID=1550230 RepID=UPI000898A595|nr:MFS transporter [Modestobacter sp. DSM 44400]SDY11797.1 Sugar phosphate permease [Modestobacter sp. DSM 44400]
MPTPSGASAPTAGDQGVLGTQRWARLLPIAFVTYSLAYLDRSNYSVAVAGGMREDLGITGGIAALLGAAFFVGYFLFQVPGALYAERRSVRTLIFWSLIAWGALASLQGVLTNVPTLMVVRFLVGVVEAAVLPAMVIFLSHWFTKKERGRAKTFLILGNPVTVLWLTVVSGYLIEATSWRWMFILEGVPAILWAFVFRALVADRPKDAGWLNPAERDGVERTLAAEQSALQPVRSWGAAMRSPNVLLLSAQYLLWSLGVYGFVFWLPTIVKAGSGQGIGLTGVISGAPYALAVLLMVLNSRASDRSGNRSLYVWPWLALGAAAFYGSYLLGPDRFWLSFVLLVIAGGAMYAPYGPYFASISEFLPARAAAPAIALVNSFGAVGGFAGSYLVGWLDSSTGSSSASFLLMALSLAVAAAVTPLVRRDRTARSAPAAFTA